MISDYHSLSQEAVAYWMDVLRPPNNVTEFVLLGLTQNPDVQEILLIVFLLIFLFTVLVNLLIVITISLSPTLSAPMYFLLTYLVLLDASFTSVTTPKLIVDLLHQRRIISWQGCMTQVFLEQFLASIRGNRPHFHGLWHLCGHLQASALHDHHATGALPTLGGGGLDWGDPACHCADSFLDGLDLLWSQCHYFTCDFFSLLELACSNTYIPGIMVAVNSGAMCLLIFFLLLISYTVILSSLKSHGSKGWLRALSTCGAHFTISSVQLLSLVPLFATPWITAHQASLSITNSRILLKLMLIESVRPSSHLILCHPLLLLPPIPPSIRVFSNKSTLRMRWPKYWSFSFSISPSNEHPGLISFRMDWLDLLAVVMFFFLPCAITYTRPVATYPMDKWVTMFSAILTPMLNPIIYTVRNVEVKNAMKNLLKRRAV